MYLWQRRNLIVLIVYFMVYTVLFVLKEIIMCTNPIHIFNRSRSFHPLTHKATLTVACGKCEQCQKRKQNDWFFRAVAEMDRVTKKGGFVLFPTLTYRNVDLPRWIDNEFNYNIPVFDKSHFVAFRTKLRMYLKREGFDFTGENTIRYLYVTEYGDKKGRSHIHCLLFIPSSIKLSLIKRLVSKAWIYGFAMYSKRHGAVVKSVKALEYVMKYMHKDQLYYEKYKIDDYIKVLKERSNFMDIPQNQRNYYHAKFLEFKRHLPHHCQSMGFGSSFELSDNDFVKGTIAPSRLHIMDTTFQYSIPIYYKRKFLYDFNKVEGIYEINPRGVHIKQLSFNNLLYSLTKYYDSVFYSNRVEDICKFDFPILLNESNFMVFKNLQSSVDTFDLAVYSLCYRGLTLPKDAFDSMCKMDSSDFLKQNRDNAYFYFMGSIGSPIIYDDYKSNGAPYAAQCHGFSDCNIYSVYEKALIFLEYFELVFGDSQNKALEKQYYRQKIQLAELVI